MINLFGPWKWLQRRSWATYNKGSLHFLLLCWGWALILGLLLSTIFDWAFKDCVQGAVIGFSVWFAMSYFETLYEKDKDVSE